MGASGTMLALATYLSFDDKNVFYFHMDEKLGRRGEQQYITDDTHFVFIDDDICTGNTFRQADEILDCDLHGRHFDLAIAYRLDDEMLDEHLPIPVLCIPNYKEILNESMGKVSRPNAQNSVTNDILENIEEVIGIKL